MSTILRRSLGWPGYLRWVLTQAWRRRHARTEGELLRMKQRLAATRAELRAKR